MVDVSTEEKTTENVKEKFSHFWESKRLASLGTFLAFIATPLVVIKMIYDGLYSIRASEFYGVPVFYFTDDLSKVALAYGVICVGTALVPIFLYFSRRDQSVSSNPIETTIFSIPVFLLSCLLFTYIVKELASNYNISWLSGGWSVLLIILVSLLVAGAYWFLLSHSNLYKKTPATDKTTETKEKCLACGDSKIKTFFHRLSLDLLLVVLFIYAIILAFNFSVSPATIDEYEVIEISPESQKVIIDHYDGNAILMGFNAATSNAESDSSATCPDLPATIVLEKSNYVIDSTEGKPIRYCKFNRVEVDNKSVK